MDTIWKLCKDEKFTYTMTPFPMLNRDVLGSLNKFMNPFTIPWMDSKICSAACGMMTLIISTTDWNRQNLLVVIDIRQCGVFVLTLSKPETFLTHMQTCNMIHSGNSYLYIYKFHCEVTLESVPGNNRFWAMRIKLLAQGNNGSLWRGFKLTFCNHQSIMSHTCLTLRYALSH